MNQGVVRYLTKAQVKSLLLQLPPHLANMVVFSLATGLRKSNVIGLYWSEVDLARRLAWIHPDQSKTRSAIAVPLNIDSLRVVSLQLGKYPVRVFTYKGEPVSQVTTAAWYKALKRCGIDDFRWHDLRHSWASWHVQNGTPLNALQELGGWESSQIVRRYAHFQPRILWYMWIYYLFLHDNNSPASQYCDKVSKNQIHKSNIFLCYYFIILLFYYFIVKGSMEPILRAISLRNVRSISMDEDIELVPITILVGKNSAGKSTFLRSFPLIRQSCEAKKRAPILWFGDRADFGSFSETIKRGAEDEGINLNFHVNIVSGIKLNSRAIYREGYANNFDAKIFINIKNSTVGRSYSPLIVISALGFEIELRVNELNNIESITAGRKRWKPKVTDYTDVSYQGILPTLTIVRERNPSVQKLNFENTFPFKDEILNRISKEKFNFQEVLLKAIYSIPFFERYSLSSQVCDRLEPLFKDSEEYTKAQVHEVLYEIEEMVFASKINDLLAILDDALRNYYAGVKYIEPIRATAQRYYRKQELGIDEIDSKGENVAMYLDNLGPWFLEEFNAWSIENFGFAVKTQSSGGHVAIVVREEGEEVYSNLADIGFGFSQILPVITQIWASQRRASKSNSATCIVIEQPELHLHPALQAKLADVFASIPNGKVPTQLVIETHSSPLINRLGQIIGEGKLKASDVQILLFSKNKNGDSEIAKSGFDDDGYLKNWPIGFFEPEW